MDPDPDLTELGTVTELDDGLIELVGDFSPVQLRDVLEGAFYAIVDVDENGGETRAVLRTTGSAVLGARR